MIKFRLKGTAFLGAAFLASIGAAHAADLPARYPVKAPPAAPAPTWDWTGFYLGGYWGNSVSQGRATTSPSAAPGTAGLVDGGWTGGGTVGLNWQFAPTWLVGVEGDFGDLGGKRLYQEFNDLGTTAGTKDTWYATARGRVGYVTGPALIYVTGGGAWVHVQDSFGGVTGALTVAPTVSNATVAGGVIGGGIEVKLSRNWSEKTEYLYIDVGNRTFGSNPFGLTGTATTFSHNFQVLKTGLNYRFDGPWDGLPFFTGTTQPSNHNWNGFYVGANAGAATAMFQLAGATTVTPGDNDLGGMGFAGGGQIGYNYMLWQKYLIGVEGDFNALAMKHSITDWNDPGVTFTEKTSWYSTIRGRVGVTTGPALLYFSGGAAFVNFQDGTVPNAPGLVLGGVTTKTSSGWTAGGGTEVALDSRWSAKLESYYIDAGSSTHPTYALFPAAVQTKERFTVVRAGLNYVFN